MINLRRWRVLLVGMTLMVVSGCDSSGTVTTLAPPNGVSSSTTSSAPSTTTSTTLVSGLRTEFVAWVAPVDGDEARLGWEAYSLPGWRVWARAQGDCWEENGFPVFAPYARQYQPARFVLNGALVPDMARLRSTGFSDTDTVSAFVDNFLSAQLSSEDGVVADIDRDPEFGFRAEDVAAIQAVAEKCNRLVQGEEYDSLLGNSDLTFQWLFRLGEIDHDPAIAALVEGTAMPCLRGLGPEFAETEDLQTWLATLTGAKINLDYAPGRSEAEFQATLTEWGQEFADCMEPLVEARRQPRLEAREAFVDEHFTELLQLQSDVDEFLAGNSQ